MKGIIVNIQTYDFKNFQENQPQTYLLKHILIFQSDQLREYF